MNIFILLRFSYYFSIMYMYHTYMLDNQDLWRKNIYF